MHSDVDADHIVQWFLLFHVWTSNGSKFVLCRRVFVLFQAEHRTMAVFILAIIVNSYTTGQVCAQVCA